MGFFARLFGHRNDLPSGTAGDATSTLAAPDDALLADLEEEARSAVLPGFSTRADAIQRVHDAYELDNGDPRAAAVVNRLWEQRLAEQATWTGPSGYDRLRAAFDELEADGVVARMNFTCCNTCGTDEIDAERTPTDSGGGYGFREWRYVFFHGQDADGLAESPTTLYLTYSAWHSDPDLDPALIAAARNGNAGARRQIVAATDAAVGHRVATALRDHGLDVTWDGDARTRIAVTITDWRKPLPL